MKYNIVINDMNRLSSSGSLSNVVRTIDYTIWVTASRDDNITYHKKEPSLKLESVSSSSNFISFESLTQEKIKAWITGSADWNQTLYRAEKHASHSVWPENYITPSTNGLPW